MGWWATGNNDDIIGDGPADIMTDALIDVVSRYGRSPVLTLQELLDVLVAALRHNPESIVSDADNVTKIQVIAEVEKEPGRLSSSASPAPDEDLLRLFYNAFEKIADEYQESGFNRKPRISELMATVNFVLGYRAESYKSITDDIPIKKISAE